MGLFGFYKPLKPVGFTYRPRFYDEKREEMLERHKAAEALYDGNPEALKSRIKRGMRRQSTYLTNKAARQQQVKKSNFRLLVIIAMMVALAFLAIEVYLPRFAYLFE